ncbi:hypothetical protein [Dactylosporangium sp. CA-092794]|uniref:hypothetical protein n=1 Tax=Dactylosporangium sp. CA-092794 TaxID=3239929 RepID=UPI003D8FD823
MAEFVVFGMVFAAVGAIAAAVLGLVIVVVYVWQAGKVLKQRELTHFAHIVLAPLIGLPVGYFFAHTDPGTFTRIDEPGTPTPVKVAVILAGLYGIWVAPLHAPSMLLDHSAEDGASARFYWALSYLAFAVAGWAYGTLNIAFQHG